MPVWHVSISAQRKGRFLDDEARVEQWAVTKLRTVGGEREWWVYGLDLNPNGAKVGHLRVAVTPEEFMLVPPDIATIDAGETGPERSRTR